MNPVNNIGQSAAVQKITTSPIQKSVSDEAPAQLPATDRLELSGASHLLKSLQNNDIRTEKVASIKAQIESGSYEDDAKLDIATDRLLDDLLK
jgi:anti-sigma28 factor (negative regulator of flagellin synthesis)